MDRKVKWKHTKREIKILIKRERGGVYDLNTQTDRHARQRPVKDKQVAGSGTQEVEHHYHYPHKLGVAWRGKSERHCQPINSGSSLFSLASSERPSCSNAPEFLSKSYGELTSSWTFWRPLVGPFPPLTFALLGNIQLGIRLDCGDRRPQ